MYVGKVTGMIIATTKNEGLVGKKLLIVQPLDMKCNPVGDCEVAVDTVGAGTGEIVLVAPIDRSIVAIIDHIEVNQ